MSVPPTTTQRVAVVAREVPLVVSALYAQAAAAVGVLKQLVAGAPQRLSALRGVAAADCVVLLGPATELPWADGVIFLGQDPRAPRLLLPTYYEPDVPLDLLERRIFDGEQPPAAPVAVLPHARRLIALGHARVPELDALAAWLHSARSAPA